jgi:cell division septum initiation protein DivIVA
MPDQHAAATEHELLTTIADPLARLPDDPLSVVAVDFPIALRGYDRFAVDAYVERTAQLVAELQATRSPEAAVRRALERVGEEISGVLQRAHDTADEITARSRAEAEERLEAARREARDLTVGAERQVKDLDAETERIWVERHSIVTDAQELAARLMELAESALERFPADPPPPEEVVTVADVDPLEAPAPGHPFDGAEALDPLLEETTMGPSDPSSTDQPTVDMPPIEPWEGEPAPFDPDQV